MKKWIAWACGVVVIACIGMAAFLFWPAGQESVTASAAQPTGAALVARGEYLAKAADCVACHTAPGGGKFAGGLAFRLPFGTIWSSNLTPDTETGIGAWTDAQFVRALRRGIGRNGENLYPAFPYTAYARLSTDDALAIRAWLVTLPPVRAAAPANNLSFPFNQRALLRMWNVLFLPGQSQPSDTSKSAVWNRGAYLVEGLGHCGECHTPRNFMFGLDQRRNFAGTEQNGWRAYNLTADPSHGLGGWSDAQLKQYLATGHADGHGPASGPMAEVVENSLRYLSPEDIHAMVVWLRGVPAQSDGPPVVQAAAPVDTTDTLGARLFAQACVGCHLPNGDGRQSPWAALLGSQTAGDPAGTNLVQVLTHGTRMQTDQGLVFMHPFTGGYTDEELASLANFTIRQFGHRPGMVTPDQIRKQRGPTAQGQAGLTVEAANR